MYTLPFFLIFPAKDWKKFRTLSRRPIAFTQKFDSAGLVPQDDFGHFVYSFSLRNSEIGNLFVPSVNKTSTGIQSITFRSIECWNKISLKYSIDLSKLSRIELKRLITGMCIHELNAVDESIYYYY